MKFYGKITVYRYAESEWDAEVTEVFSEKFEAKSIQSAKARLTKISSETELFSWIQSWDNETRRYTGKDLRWKAWSDVATYKQNNGVEVAHSTRSSERESGEQIYPEKYGKYGKSVGYRVDLSVYWRFKGK